MNDKSDKYPDSCGMREMSPTEMLRISARELHDRAHDYEQLADQLDRLIITDGAAKALRFLFAGGSR